MLNFCRARDGFMKKIIAVFFIGILVLSLVSCDKTRGKTNVNDDNSSSINSTNLVGSFNGSVYKNNVIGFSFTLPEGFTANFSDDWDEGSIIDLETFFASRDNEHGDDDSCSIWVQPVLDEDGAESSFDEILSSLVDAYQGDTPKLVKDFCGHEAYMFDNTDVHRIHYVINCDDKYYIHIILKAESNEALGEINNGFSK